MSGSFHISAGHALGQAQHGNKAAGSHSTSSPKANAAHVSEAGENSNSAQHAAAGSEAAQDAKAGKSDTQSHDKHKTDKAFPAMFHSMMQDGKADPNLSLDKALADEIKDAKGDKSDKAKTDAAAQIGLPMFAAGNGKELPQLSWSGVVGVADNKGAVAMAMQGDPQNAVATQPVNGKDLPNAVLKAQEQLAHNQLQQGATPGVENNQFSAALNKAHQPSLNMAHQFLADNASLPQMQTAAANGNAHNVLAQDLNGLASASAARSVANNAQQISVPVQQPQWAQQLGDRVHWLVGQNVHQAAIHLNPPELGQLDVHIQMHGDQASVNFSSPHAVVRHAVDAAIPRLREMMHETGLTLGDVNVSGQAMAQQQQSRDSHSQQGQQRGRVGAIAAVDGTQAAGVSTTMRRLSSNGMLDVYA